MTGYIGILIEIVINGEYLIITKGLINLIITCDFPMKLNIWNMSEHKSVVYATIQSAFLGVFLLIMGMVYESSASLRGT